MLLCTVSLLLTQLLLLEALEDLETAALTVYRNPDFFGRLGRGFDSHGNLQDFRTHDFFGSFSEDFFNHDSPFNVYNPQRSNQEEDSGADDGGDDGDGGNDGEDGGGDGDGEESDAGFNEEDGENINGEQEEEEEENEAPRKRYKYPGEPKKPNPPGKPNINVHYDDSPDFQHPSRNVPPSSRPPKKGRGPYGHPRHDDEETLVRENTEDDEYETQREDQQSYPVQGHDEDDHEEIHHPEDTQQIIETKKGTREYLKHHRLPTHHEANHVDRPGNERKFNYKISLPKKKYVYRIRPVYSRYRVIPLKRKKFKKVFIIQPVYQKR